MRLREFNEVREALRLVLTEKRLWPAAILVSFGLSESWRALFGWDPLWVGEKAGNIVGGTSGSMLGVLAIILSFLVLRALGVLGEMALIGQASGIKDTPGLMTTVRGVKRRYLPLALTYLPYELARLFVISVPARIVYSWSRFDPRLRLWPLYLLFIGIWGSLLFLLYGPAAALVRLAARESVLGLKEPLEAWSKGWEKARGSPAKCVMTWFWALIADVAFILPAWMFAAILPWMGRGLGRLLGVPVIRALPPLLFYALLASLLLAGQTLVQAFKSVLWTRTWLAIEKAETPIPSLSPPADS